MMSDFLQNKYHEAYSAFESVVEGSKFIIRHRSLKKYEDKTNQDILFLLNDKYCHSNRVYLRRIFEGQESKAHCVNKF